MAVLAVAEAEVALVEDDLLSTVTAAHAKCLKLHAATAEKSARFLSDPQTVSLFTAVIVLKRWEMEEDLIQGVPKEMILEPQVLIKKPSLML